jgi:LPS O-antigen subunit length determinant protein (WzzB/FepE family)
MEIQINQEVIDTVCNSLRASKQSLRNQLRSAECNKKEIIEHQLADVERALEIFQHLES